MLGLNSYVPGIQSKSNTYSRGTRRFPCGARYVGEFFAGELHGQGTFFYNNGDKYSGNWVWGNEQGQGSFTSANGDNYTGKFYLGKSHGEGLFTQAHTQYKGIWKNDVYTHSDKSQKTLLSLMGSPAFAEQVGGVNRVSPPLGYIQAILFTHVETYIQRSSDTLKLQQVSNLLKEAYELSTLLPKEFKFSILHKLESENEVALHYYCDGHAMFLKLKFSDLGLDIEVYNSGRGLEKHLQDPIHRNKYQTCKIFRFAGLKKDSVEFIKLINDIEKMRTKTVDQAYDVFKKGVVIAHDGEYQREQKSGNCQLESSMAFLKKNLGASLYHEYRLHLIIDTKDQLQLRMNKNECFPNENDNKILKRLETMIENRHTKFSNFGFELEPPVTEEPIPSGLMDTLFKLFY